MKTEKTNNQPRHTAKENQKMRLSAALRANLQRRKKVGNVKREDAKCPSS